MRARVLPVTPEPWFEDGHRETGFAGVIVTGGTKIGRECEALNFAAIDFVL